MSHYCGKGMVTYMEIRKQLTFDIALIRRNKIIYLFLLCEIALAVLLLFLPDLHNEISIGIIVLLNCILTVTIIISFCCLFEDRGMAFLINKLTFYPTTKVRFLLSKTILLFCMTIIQLGCNAVFIIVRNRLTITSASIDEFRISSIATVASVLCLGVLLVAIRHITVFIINVIIFISIYVNVMIAYISTGDNGILVLIGIALALCSMVNIFNLLRE
ncbi:MAG TPA: hypothetical protein VHQ24_13345 [Lachnospiraceae bacterium]|nr:hypothetical protein [Lachnospiraceae bacterium]